MFVFTGPNKLHITSVLLLPFADNLLKEISSLDMA